MPLDSLTAAIVAGDADTVRTLLAQHAGIARTHDAHGVPVLLVACYHRQAEIVGLLRDARQRRGEPLDVHEAAAVGDPDELAAALRAAPLLQGTWSADGFTALHLAAFFGKTENVRLLLAEGADPRAVARNPSCVQPLHSAAAARELEIARLLVAAGADVNARQQGGWTPLHAAAAHGDEPLARLLLAHGAEPGVANELGRTPSDLARENDHEALARLVESALTA
jgi:ankyrin repeat protein